MRKQRSTQTAPRDVPVTRLNVRRTRDLFSMPINDAQAQEMVADVVYLDGWLPDNILNVIHARKLTGAGVALTVKAVCRLGWF